jgi:hypothetical protein
MKYAKIAALLAVTLLAIVLSAKIGIDETRKLMPDPKPQHHSRPSLADVGWQSANP